MKRITITGSIISGRTILANALSAMTGFDFIACLPYSSIAAKYGLDLDISRCQWPDSFTYCLGAFTQRVMIEQKLENEYISDGSVLNEVSWLKCRYPHTELIYERSMIQSLENVVADYALKEYDFIFHIDSGDPSDVIEQCLKQIYLHRRIKHHTIDGTNGEVALNQMLEYLQIRPVLSAKYALLKSDKEPSG